LSGTGDISIRDFYKRRALRIFPAYYCFLLAYIIFVKVSAVPMNPGSEWSALFYLSDLYYVADVPIRGLVHTWSLAIEERFYLLWPLVLLWQRGNLARLAKGLAVAIMLVQIWRAVLVFGSHVPDRRIDFPFDTQCDGLLIGCLLAILIHLWP